MHSSGYGGLPSNIMQSTTTVGFSDALGSDRQHSMVDSTARAMVGSGRHLRMANNTQERIKKGLEDSRMLDTTPNVNID